MQSFNLPLSRRLDFGVDSNGHAFFRAYDERTNLHLTPDELAALFELIHDNGEKLAKEIKALEGGNHG
jgi:hypothetical protein